MENNKVYEAEFAKLGYREILKAAQDLSNQEKEKLVAELLESFPSKKMIVILSANNVLHNSVNFQIGQGANDLEKLPQESLVKILDALSNVIENIPDA